MAIARALIQHDKKLEKTIPRILGASSGHEKDWIRACKGGPVASSNFDYSGPLTESVLLGSVAVRFPQTTLKWNAAKLAFDNESAANRHVRRSYRAGWKFPGIS